MLLAPSIHRLLVACAAAVAFAPAAVRADAPPPKPASPPPSKPAAPAPGPSAPAASLTPAQIAEKAIPSVVLIRIPTGLGSGFVVAADGRIVTNLHVIAQARSATVVLSDGREFSDVQVMGADYRHDLALLRIGAKGLAPIALGDSARVRVGERVVAIGHPLGLGNTVSDGLVSALRDIGDGLSVLQVSAPISPGSSGGPLLNDRGQVIGVSTLIVTKGQNLNFGVPVDAIKPLLASTKGVPIASWTPEGAGGGGGIVRHVPQHDLKLLADCTIEDLKFVAGRIEQAINAGAPLYDDGNHEACYQIYLAAALEIDRKVTACKAARRALLDGVKRADGIDGFDAKAWAMRDAFDGMLDVIGRKATALAPPGSSLPAPPRRRVPNHPLTLLDDCNADGMGRIRKAVANAIHLGAPLYNERNFEACFRIYEGAILELDRTVPTCVAARHALAEGLAEAQHRASFSDKAWALRDAFDGVLDVIQRKLEP
jgi:S1-C subfamily serine protease